MSKKSTPKSHKPAPAGTLAISGTSETSGEVTTKLKKKTPTDEPSIQERALAKQKTLISARDQLRTQLSGVENQLYAIDELLNPKPIEAPPDDPLPPEQDQGSPLKKGTI